MRHLILSFICLFTVFCGSLQSQEINQDQQSLPDSVEGLRSFLDIINFDLKDKKKLSALKRLISHTESLLKRDDNNDNAGLLMMAGFFNAQYAGAIGGFGALKYAKASRKHLQKSVDLDPTFYDSAAHVVLGSLYAQVPRWPIGYGSKRKAVIHYQAALKLAPNGIDSNFTYGQYLFAQKKYAKAKPFFEKAKLAAPRPDRPKADSVLKRQADVFLKKIEKQLADK